MFIYESMALWGGIERIWTDRMNLLAKQYGAEILLITANQGEHPYPYDLDSRITVKDLKIQFHHAYKYRGVRRRREIRYRQELFETRLKEEIDIFHPDIITGIAAHSYIPTIIKVKGDIPMIAESHELALQYYHLSSNFIVQYFRLRNLRHALSKVEQIVSLTNEDAREWKNLNSNVTVIPNIVHLNNTGYLSDGNTQRVIFVGRLAQQKGLPLLLDIWKKVHQRHPNWQLDIYGEGEMRKWLHQQIADDSNIHVYQPTGKVMDEYLSSALMVSTSVYEPFGLVIPEAMSCGLPVVAFDCPHGPRNIITSGEDGFLVSQGNCDEFADRVCYLIEHPEERIAMGKKAALSVQRFQASNIMPQWMALYQKFINGSSL